MQKASSVATPDAPNGEDDGPAVEEPVAEDPDAPNGEDDSTQDARFKDLVTRSATIPMGTIVHLIMDAEVPQPVNAVKVSKNGDDSWEVIGPTGDWLHPHHKLGSTSSESCAAQGVSSGGRG